MTTRKIALKTFPLKPLLWFFILLFSKNLHAQLYLHISQIPANTPENADIYFAGNINNWNPGDENFVFTQLSDNSYGLLINELAPTNLQFKFTRGSWETVEGNSEGFFLPNRTYNYAGGEDTLQLSIAGWEDVAGNNSTANEQVSILAEDFYMPQLNRYRRIWIYLPTSYNSSPQRHYPVLYMHDGQNLFDQATSFAGEWEVDETLSELALYEQGQIIVVGIDNGGSYRIGEYTPYPNAQYGGGEGDAYVQFIVNTLKPYIDTNYRTLPERENTGIMGSSLGGLISFYAGISYADTFGKIGVFSPSFWFNNTIYTLVEETPKTQNSKMYFLAGAQESADMVPDMQTMYNLLLENNYATNELAYVVKADGQHSEWFWAREFKDAYLWLFENENTALGSDNTQNDIRISPVPATNSVFIEVPASAESYRGVLRNTQSQIIDTFEISNQHYHYATDSLANGVYWLEIWQHSGLLSTKKLLIQH
ncbi:MAG: alpha/beta hydrolase-fold protein [Chitinophagales bacterium]|nr:alpha/beta hydrolase [Chitinophagales bacterium]